MGKLLPYKPGDLAQMINSKGDEDDELDDFTAQLYGRNYPGPRPPTDGVGLVIEAGPVDERGQQDVLLDFSGTACWATNCDLKILS